MQIIEPQNEVLNPKDVDVLYGLLKAIGFQTTGISIHEEQELLRPSVLLPLTALSVEATARANVPLTLMDNTEALAASLRHPTSGKIQPTTHITIPRTIVHPDGRIEYSHQCADGNMSQTCFFRDKFVTSEVIWDGISDPTLPTSDVLFVQVFKNIFTQATPVFLELLEPYKAPIETEDFPLTMDDIRFYVGNILHPLLQRTCNTLGIQGKATGVLTFHNDRNLIFARWGDTPISRINQEGAKGNLNAQTFYGDELASTLEQPSIAVSQAIEVTGLDSILEKLYKNIIDALPREMYPKKFNRDGGVGAIGYEAPDTDFLPHVQVGQINIGDNPRTAVALYTDGITELATLLDVPPWLFLTMVNELVQTNKKVDTHHIIGEIVKYAMSRMIAKKFPQNFHSRPSKRDDAAGVVINFGKKPIQIPGLYTPNQDFQDPSGNYPVWGESAKKLRKEFNTRIKGNRNARKS
jgi:hypothetical protein